MVLYRRGKLSAGAAAEFVGDLDRYEFLYECRQRGIEPQTYESIEELQAEIDMLGNQRRVALEQVTPLMSVRESHTVSPCRRVCPSGDW